MRTYLRCLLAIVVLSAAALLAGCASSPSSSASTSASPAAINYGSSLAYPERLQPTGDASGAMRWKDPVVDFRKYDKILIERIRVQLASDSASLAPDDLKALTDYFHQTLVKALDPPYGVVTRAERGVLRMRITLVDLVATKPEMSVVVLLTPYATLPDLAAGASGGRPAGSATYLGKTAIAVEFIDGETNAVVAEYAETRFGRKYVLDTNQGVTAGVTEGAKNYLDAYSTWAYAKQAFDGWSQQFRARLDQINGRG
jgi:Protein of unknown function (DUF3313)